VCQLPASQLTHFVGFAHGSEHIETGATDVGGGTSFNMLRTMGEAYKVCQLRGGQLHPLHGLYLMTQGSAVALGLDEQIGNLNPGSDADFVILDPYFDELTQLRFTPDSEAQDILFALSMLGDDRATVATYIAGTAVYTRGSQPVVNATQGAVNA